MKDIINQIFALESKSKEHQIKIFERNYKRLYFSFEDMGFKIVNPIGIEYDYRDSSIEANIMHNEATTITKVLKPAIYKEENGTITLIQKSIVIVE